MSLATGQSPASLPPFTGLELITQSRIDPVVLSGLVVAGALYLWGIQRLRTNGVVWPGTRSAAFLGGGLGSIAIATMSGIGSYDVTLFSLHMVQHMILGMVAPIFLALGAPVTLALRALPLTGRRTLNVLLHSRVGRFVGNPVVGFLLFVSTPFLLYFTAWYPATLQHEWLHELTHVHFLLVGCIFFWPLIGLDPVPGRVSHPMRMLILVGTLPIHAILGLTIMQSNTLIAASYYSNLGLAWSNPFSEQRVAGGLLWASGDLVGLLMMIVAMYQWMRASEREAVREDRRLDRLERLAQERSEPTRATGI